MNPDFFKECIIMIPSKGRANKQITFDSLPLEFHKNTRILVEPEEVTEYCKYVPPANVIGLPYDLKGIGNVRQWAVEYCLKHDKPFLFLLDDDMTFCVRDNMQSTKLRASDGYDITCMFTELWDWLDWETPLVGISARQGNNHVNDEYREATRQMNFHGINVKMFSNLGLVFNGLPVMEDFYMTLTLLSQGIGNRVSYKYCWNQRGSGAEGGCSSYRTWEVQRDAALKLAETFPDYVTVVKKKSKSVWKDMPERYDVRVQWKKCYEERINEL